MCFQETTESSNVDSEGLVTMSTPGKQAEIKILCTPLPASVTDILDKNVDLIKTLDKFISSLEKVNKIEDGLEKLNLKDDNVTNIPLQLSEKTLREISFFKDKLAHAFSEAGPPWSEDNFVEKIWSFGPRRCGPNILFNTIKGIFSYITFFLLGC